MKPATKSPVRIAVVEGDPLRFLGFRAIFSSEADFQVHASTVASLIKFPNEDVVLMTANKGAAFYAAMSAFRAARPGLRILVTGPGSDDEDILRALLAGAKGYICEDAPAAEFIQAIRVVHSASVWAPRRVLSLFIERVTSPARKLTPQEEDKISEREREVLRLLVAGRSNREIGLQLKIEERTVKAHVAQLMRKVGVQNRIALSVHAVTHSLLSTQY